MLKHFFNRVFACIIITILFINTLACAAQLFPLAIIKFLIPFKWWRKILNKILIRVANNWVLINSLFIHYCFNIKWNITGLEKLKKKDWYLVISNHQSWVDIIIIQKILYGRIPYIKFFLKKELIWVPIMGPAWWALDFPFMKRYTKEQVARNPKLKGKDIEITRKACEKFKTEPVAIMTFPEGTRFTPEKHDMQNSPYEHLLKAKAGGVSFTISSMGEHLHKLLNITIIYPEGPKSLWDFLCRKIRSVDIVVETVDIPEHFVKANIEDPAFQKEFTGWLNEIWSKKDQLIHRITEEKKSRSGPSIKF
ncbi:MAG: acyltransferase [Spirochaetae bacterium HGW-Spirochaetae-1]|jgi:1-acyl-sn-glycerol-3-phosphate acyltransferase|nr:MAG: acyltransferase [Spirochaetae bacterium HGW-Spirochaetae-1]